MGDLPCVQLASYLEGNPTDVDDAPAPARHIDLNFDDDENEYANEIIFT